ncbi:MAG: sulfatase [Pirellulales bacterium]|nr:sulfatase [Pirellulales bacterium]
MAICLGSPSARGEDQPPNVIVIFMDDMGYADINPFGDNPYPTPHLNRMAAEGRRFTDFVVSSAVCSASRSALLTGCYHRRVGIQGALGPKSQIGIHSREVTLAELCKSKGYSTAIFGKWHLGHHPKFLPHNHGFDEYYGIPYSNDMWPLHPNSVAKRKQDPKAKISWPALPMIRATPQEGVKIVDQDVQPEDQAQMTRQFTEHAVDFIQRNADQPFFLYLPHPMVHVPLYASEDFRGQSGAGIFGDVVMEIDWSVGQILNAVQEIGAEENTLVIFTSDNGPWLSYGTHSGKATPLREGKGTMFEGGYREPTLMWWKGKIPAGTSCDQLCSTIDILPTVAKLIGAELPDHPIDGKDIRPLMFGQQDAKSPHDAFYCYYKGGELQAVRNERFKLVFPHSYRTLKGRPGGFGGKPVAYFQDEIRQLTLFDLDNDIAESKNVLAQHPGVIIELKAAAERARADLGDKLTRRVGKGIRPAGKLQPADPRLPLDWTK